MTLTDKILSIFKKKTNTEFYPTPLQTALLQMSLVHLNCFKPD